MCFLGVCNRVRGCATGCVCVQQVACVGVSVCVQRVVDCMHLQLLVLGGNSVEVVVFICALSCYDWLLPEPHDRALAHQKR